MARSGHGSTDIGRFIRQQVIPQGMTVTEAARRLGVGRPALSNLLNGKAALSPNMALRLEETFGADRARLLDLQAASDRERRSVEDRAVAVGTYTPSFLTIEARQIAQWAAGDIRARDRLPVLLRRLIHAGRREPRRVDFPGSDNAQRHGWDGWVEADSATSWVPEGRSGWELSVDGRPRAKAERDYQARLKMLSQAERAECSFVFVTPRNWAGKVEWERGKAAAADWKAVRALDASDLEQWLEETTAPRIWLARELDIPTKGFETLDHFWERWAAASDPPMSAQIFAPAVAAHRDDFRKWIERTPDRPLTVAADSREEAVAFVACLLSSDDALAHHRTRAVVFGSAPESAPALRALAPSSSPFIPIVYSADAEREIATLYRRRHCIVVRPRNAVDREPEVTVDLLGHEAFEQALADMGVERERVASLTRESGRSPTVLRRRLSPVGAIRTPAWAGDRAVARRLISMILVGAWHSGSAGDREILAVLADSPYEEVEKDVADLLQRDDCPVWRVDRYRGVVSKIDALFATSRWMTHRDITHFVDFAEYVLSESDPALDLPDDQRWAAGLYGKVREHSSALRNGVCETLVMLSVHGTALFRDLGIDAVALVAALIKRLLTPLTRDKLRSHDENLPGYAEAAPDEFLALLEEDLTRPKPVLEELLKPAGVGMFDNPLRTGVLWALERLAWNPKTFMRVIVVLSRLSETQIDDNWVNKPMNSLSAILRAWLPQTAAPLSDRIKALEVVHRRFPDVGWRVCIQQFDGRQQVAFPNNRPRWRRDAAGAGHGVAGTEAYEFCRKALDLAIAWPTHDEGTLGDLVERLGDLPIDDRSRIWNLIDRWSRAETDEKARAALREKIRLMVLGRWGALRGLDAGARDRARAIYEKLASRDPIRRHAWLFAGAWVDYSADELDEEELDAEEREKRIDALRTHAMMEIWSARGLEGALGLLADGDGWTIGCYSARSAASRSATIDVLRSCLSMEIESSEKLDYFMRGFISCIEEGMRSTVIATVAANATVDRRVRLFRCAPFVGHTWRLLDGQERCVRDGYWRSVSPAMGRFSESETTEIVDRLLEAERAQEAFAAVRFDWDKVETSRLKRLLGAVINVSAERAGRLGEMRPWYLSRALDSLDGRAGVTVDEMAQLEFAFIDALVLFGGSRRQTHGIPNLERKMAEAPGLFVQAVALLYKREDDGQDPPEWRIDDPERLRAVGTAAYRLLDGVRRVPGADDDGRVDGRALRQWVTEARRLGRQYGRFRMGDRHIGQLLSRAPSESEDAWPCRAVCEVLEAVASGDVADGFTLAVFNARGVVSRGWEEGGEQERKLSAQYETWARRWNFEYPFVARILDRIAERYGHDAEREDSEVLVMKRLEH